MKLFVITCLKEDEENVYKIFRNAGIKVSSATDVVGFKHDTSLNVMEQWFASGEERFDSVMLFSFTTEENADNGMGLINKYNEQSGTGFPVRAFIIPVEKSNY